MSKEIIKSKFAKKEDSSTSSSKSGKVFKSDTKQATILMKGARAGAAKAIRIGKALGLDITYMEKGIIYTEKPDGTREIISTATNSESVKHELKLKKGMVLHAKK